MAVKITSVCKESPAYAAGIVAGDILVSINENKIYDVLDYRFYETEPHVSLVVENTAGIQRSILIRKGEYEPLGLEFATYLMDQQHSCRNRCVFCFIDQLPPNMRESLYFKDDDSRLSFLFGNYITLTNLSEHEVSRIIKMHISPVNISVHTMNPELRKKMMGNRFAGSSLQIINRFAEAGIKMNCQLVLCPGINDGEELERSLRELGNLCPSVQSIAVVPVGLTRFRENLYPLTGYTREQAGAVIDIVERFGKQFLKEYKDRIVYAADEFYLKAGRDLPEATFYGDFAQLENGVGLIASLRDEFFSALEDFEGSDLHRTVSVATGVAAAPFIKQLLDELCLKCHNLICQVFAIQNHFFGETIDVAGLITGQDLIGQLKGKQLGDLLLIPSVMLRKDDSVFLDDTTLEELQKTLQVKVVPIANDGWELFETIVGE